MFISPLARAARRWIRGCLIWFWIGSDWGDFVKCPGAVGLWFVRLDFLDARHWSCSVHTHDLVGGKLLISCAHRIPCKWPRVWLLAVWAPNVQRLTEGVSNGAEYIDSERGD